MKCGTLFSYQSSFDEFLIDDIHRFKFINSEIRVFPVFIGGDKSIRHWFNETDIHHYLSAPHISASMDGMLVDAVVNSANNFLIPGSGLSKYISQKMGDEYDNSIKQIIKNNQNIEKGKSYFTAFDKKNYRIRKGIIQTISIEYRKSGNQLIRILSRSKDIYNCTFSAMKLADDNNLESIAFPQMATRNGYSIYNFNSQRLILTATINAIIDYIISIPTHIKTIYVHPTDYIGEKILVTILNEISPEINRKI